MQKTRLSTCDATLRLWMSTFNIVSLVDPYWTGQLRHVPVTVTVCGAAIWVCVHVPACVHVCVWCMPYLRSAVLKLFSSGNTRAISITCGTFYLTLNYKPDLALSKLQHRPFTHNYVLWIMAMCLKYKHLDGIDCTGFMSWRSWQNEWNISGNGWEMQMGSKEVQVGYQTCWRLQLSILLCILLSGRRKITCTNTKVILQTRTSQKTHTQSSISRTGPAVMDVSLMWEHAVTESSSNERVKINKKIGAGAERGRRKEEGSQRVALVREHCCPLFGVSRCYGLDRWARCL